VVDSYGYKIQQQIQKFTSRIVAQSDFMFLMSMACLDKEVVVNMNVRIFITMSLPCEAHDHDAG
jgi:hypothetical protein